MQDKTRYKVLSKIGEAIADLEKAKATICLDDDLSCSTYLEHASEKIGSLWTQMENKQFDDEED